MNVLVVGAGNIYLKQYRSILLNYNKVEKIYIFEPQREVKVVSKEKQVQELEKAISNCDCAIVLSPSYTHYNYTKKILSSNKSVFCEKPLCFKKIEAEKLLSLADNKGANLFVGTVNNHRPEYSFLKEYLNEKVVTNIRANWKRAKGVPALGSWFTNREMSLGGALIDLGSHIISFLQGVYPFETRKISSTEVEYDIQKESSTWYDVIPEDFHSIDVEKQVITKLLTKSNTKIEFEISWDSSVEKDYVEFVFENSEEEIVFRDSFGFSPNREINETTINIVNMKRMKSYNFEKQNVYQTALRKFLRSEPRIESRSQIISSIQVIEDIYGSF
jgi:predicted dehydrogenase